MRKRLLRSRSGFEKPESREEAIMQNILGASNVLEPSESNIEEILKSILYNTPYTKEAEFEIEKILLAIKNNGTYDGEVESRDMKILLAILRESNYTEETESRIEELYVEWLQQRSQIKVLEGVPPLTYTARGLPLINYLIEGNTIDVVGVGTLETSGEHAGQYIIPILNGGVTTNVYLGEVESTRRIKKLVLDGTGNWSAGTENFYRFIDSFGEGVPYSSVICTHAQHSTINNTGKALFMKKSDFSPISSVADFKTYLAAQYAAGTPVCVWYVLSTSQTAVVNEPLMRIGDYTDSISMEQTGIEIPTINGSNTFDVDTTVKPSNVYIEYK